MNVTKLTPSEWNVLNCLWEKSPQTVMQLVGTLEQSVGWARSTTITTLRRMEAKGLVRSEKAVRGTAYVPVVERDGAVLAETKRFIDRVYQGSVGMMMSAMVAGGLSREELAQLRAVLDEAEGRAQS